MPDETMETAKEKKSSAVDHVVDQIIDGIIRGETAPGDRLPTEPELSQKYGVGRNTVREAIKQLQAFGILYIRRADGTYVADSYQGKMLSPMLYSLILQRHDWKDFVQLRAVIDIGTLQVALRDPNVNAAIPRLQKLVDRLDLEVHSAAPSVDRILELDLQFHTAIAQIVDNPQIDTVTSYITRLTAPSRHEVVRHWLDAGEQDAFLALHQKIVQVIATHDVDAITDVIEEHYIYWK